MGAGLCPFFVGVELGPHLTQCGRGPRPTYVRAKFHLDLSSRLATIHQRHRQDRTGQTGQRSDSIGQTVLQTVTQKVLFTSLQMCIIDTVHLTATCRSSGSESLGRLKESHQ